jgi:transcriptional regulator with XRE-family HTH domain
MDIAGRKRFGAAIRRLRTAKHLTQEGLAERARLHPSYIGGIERGERNLGLDNILRLARALSTDPGALFADFRK